MAFSWSYRVHPACLGMVKMIILILWLSSVSEQTSIIKQVQWYKPYPRTWMDARENCKSEHNGDLALENDVNQMYMGSFYAWIGLRKSGSNWYWDNGNGQDVQSYFFKPNGKKECGQVFSPNQQPLDDDCENLHFFYCRHYSSSYYYPYYPYYWNYNYRDIFVPKTKTWEGAKKYCVGQSYEFTAITQTNEPLWDIVSSPRNFPVWIGQYQNGECGAIWSQNKTWSYQNCSEALPFLCSAHNLRLVQDLLTWEQSYHHCKSYTPDNYTSYQLVSVNIEDHKSIQFVASNATTHKVWLGLRFIGGSWFWSDGAVLSLPNLPSCPEPNLYCGALVVNRKSSTSEPIIELSDCSEKLNLLCYGL